MNILEQALNKIKPIHKKQKLFLLTCIQGLIGAVGKRTFRNLARYTGLSEHTFSRQMAKIFDFVGVNIEIVKLSKSDSDVVIASQDASFVSKSGKSTEGLDYHWNGCAGKAEKGLEIDVVAVIKMNEEKKEAYTVSVQQTPANPIPKMQRKKLKNTGPSKIDFYLDHITKIISRLLDLGVQYMVADAFYAKNKYVNGVLKLGLHVISKMRKDARLMRLYTGPQKVRGRKKKLENIKVNSGDFDDASVIKIDEKNGQTELRSLTVYSVSLKRVVKVVLIRRWIGQKKYGEALLFSTDVELETLNVYQYYVARFQIEFIFRDAKGFTGLADCQSRNALRLHSHFNMSLLALNIVRFQDRQIQQKQKTRHAFSMASWARKYHVEIVLNRFISMF